MDQEKYQTLDHSPMISAQILKDFTAGIFANCIGTFIGHPLDTVKVRMQLSPSSASFPSIITQILKNEGLTGLFKGVMSPLLGQAPIGASAFMANDFAKRGLCRTSMSENKQSFISGCFTGACTTIFTTPTEYMKIKKQAYKGENLTYSSIIKQEGVKGIFKGYNATVMRDVPGWCAYFFAYDFLKRTFDYYLGSQDNNKRSAFISQFFAGGFAGQISWVVSYPADVVKSYIQYHPENTSILQTARLLYSRKGIKYFFNGFSP